MMLLRVSPILLSALLLAAHFSRADNLPLMVLSLTFPLLLLVRKPWAARVTQLILVLGGVEWIRTLVVLAARRIEVGEGWVRLAVILGAVVVVTFSSALVFQRPAVRARYFS